MLFFELQEIGRDLSLMKIGNNLRKKQQTVEKCLKNHSNEKI